MTVKNGGATIGDAIKSIYRQTYAISQIVVIDDRSTDDSHAIANDLLARGTIPYHLASSESAGRGYALRQAVFQASGDWIAIIDADDVWHTRKTEIQVAAICQCNHDDIGVCGTLTRPFSNLSTIESDHAMICPVKNSFRQITARQMLYCNCLPHSSVLLRREYAHYDVSLKSQYDYELWMRLMVIQKVSALRVEIPLTLRRVHDRQHFQSGRGSFVYALRSAKHKLAYSILLKDPVAFAYNLCKPAFFVFPTICRERVRRTLRRSL
ncbi:MAG: glycosyltransferase [Planctomycetales bacterium]|nr:glycosyltransferase [Planctomycetales bacterium]